MQARASSEAGGPLGRVAGGFAALFERFFPDPYLFAVILTMITALLAAVVTHRGFWEILTAWYAGIFGPAGILRFAFEMILVLVTGYALANAVPVRRLLERLAMAAATPRRAIMITVVVSSVACGLNWGFGLVVAGLLAREMAKRVRVDFAWLVAAAYTGFLIWASGLSSSIALAQATPGSALNIVHRLTGHDVPLSHSLFTLFNIVPVLVLLIAMPAIFAAMQPPQSASVYADQQRLREEDAVARSSAPVSTVASVLENAWIFNLVLAVAALAYLVRLWTHAGPDIDSVILLFLALGLLLHGKPIAYVAAVNNAARITGPLILQYPLYGGIMGIMSGTGLAALLAKGFIVFATAATLPFWSFIASIIISIFVPSGGGHWAIQGPFVVPAAAALHASQGATAMGVAMGEEVANMIQPFWALPIIAIAGIGIRRVFGYTVVSFFVSLVVFGGALLLLGGSGA